MGGSVKNKLIVAVVITLIILVSSFLYFYFQRPVVRLKKNLTAEVNTDRNLYNYILAIEKGLLITKDKKIDTTKLGYQKIKIKTQNIVKKVYSKEIKILIKDTTAPEIIGPTDITITAGSEVDLLKDVKVVDNSKEDIKATVEGEYNINNPGTYNLKYIAEDSSHNKSEKEFVLIVKKKVIPKVQTSFSNESKIVRNGYPYYIKVNRRLNVVYVYGIEDGEYKKLVKVFVCSAGANTPLGVYSTKNKYVWRLMVGDSYAQYATRITGHYLFHSVPYQRQSKDSLKYWLYNRLGNNDSLGCIRLTVEDAKWIYDNCPIGTKVEIYNSNDLGGVSKPSAQKISDSDPRRGWDPTDPDPANPWK